ncbi:MAG: hypothetical protein H6707_18865 [Deltaproteobacteria bacterium]|nr:hypothetical protein [Deltaproteobacteria bacterium]
MKPHHITVAAAIGITATLLCGQAFAEAEATPEPQIVQDGNRRIIKNHPQPFDYAWVTMAELAQQGSAASNSASVGKEQPALPGSWGSAIANTFHPLNPQAMSLHAGDSGEPMTTMASWAINTVGSARTRGALILNQVSLVDGLPSTLSPGVAEFEGKDPLAHQGVGLNAAGDKLIVAGGNRVNISRNNPAAKSVFEIDVRTGKSQKVAEAPLATIAPAVTATKDQIFIAGGYAPRDGGGDGFHGGPLRKLQIYDKTTKRWSIHDLPSAGVSGRLRFVSDVQLSERGAVSKRNYLVMFGGTQQSDSPPHGDHPRSEPSDKVLVVDLQTQRSQEIQLENARSQPAVLVRHTVIGPEIVFVGGHSGSTEAHGERGAAINTVESYNLRLNAWHRGIMPRSHPDKGVSTSGVAGSHINGTAVEQLHRLFVEIGAYDASTRCLAFDGRGLRLQTTRNMGVNLKAQLTTTSLLVQRSTGCVLSDHGTIWIGRQRHPQQALNAWKQQFKTVGRLR